VNQTLSKVQKCCKD